VKKPNAERISRYREKHDLSIREASKILNKNYLRNLIDGIEDINDVRFVLHHIVDMIQ